MISQHRALSLAIAALGDAARTIDNVGYDKSFAAEIREASDHLIALRDNSPETRSGYHTQDNSINDLPTTTNNP